MILNKNKICVVAAHPDDEVFGLGGTLLKAADNGCEINVIFLTNGEDARDSVDKNAILHRKNCAIKAKEFIGANDYKFLDFPDNKLDSVPLLNVIKKLEEFFIKTTPEIIFTHFSNDLNIDHQIAFQSTITASRPTSNNPTKYIFSYEVLSSSDYIYPVENQFNADMFSDISDYVEKKHQLLKIYESELHLDPNSRSLKNFEANSINKGMSVGIPYAEGFKLIRGII